MEISFADQKLQKQCESRQALQKAHGQACAKKVMARLADLLAVASLEEMRQLAGRCHELKGDRAGSLAIDVGDGKRLVIEPTAPMETKGGGLDWARVDAVRVLEIKNYHRG